jgi:hypothetical protein
VAAWSTTIDKQRTEARFTDLARLRARADAGDL